MSDTPKKILIVEDEKILREAYQQILEHEGFKVVTAANGRLGLEELDSFKPDLILLDILMPELDGLEFLNLARLPRKHPHIKVIAFSNLSDQQKLEKMVKLGVSENLLKSSLSPKQLATAVKSLLS